MSDFISRSALINDLKKNFCTYPPAVKAAIERAPAADVEPIVHAHWIEEMWGDGWNDYIDRTCSACRKKFKKFEKTKRCPECGAKMDEVSE